jgi:hypothetical protein
LVSQVKDWILPDIFRYTLEMKQGLQRVLERLLARQTEELKARIVIREELTTLECDIYQIYNETEQKLLID